MAQHKQKAGNSMENFQHMDALLKRLTAERLPGIGCVMTKGQEVIYEGYYGYADIENRTPVDASTVFRIYSMTRLPIYTLCMLLYEQGLFLPDDPLSQYFPEYASMKKFVQLNNGAGKIVPLQNPILVKHILTMSMGLPYGNDPIATIPTEAAMYKMHQALQEKGPFSLREEIRAAAEVPVAFEPGTHWMYGFASELSAGLCEVLTGKEIEQALIDSLFAPLEMTSTGMRFFGDIPQRLSKFYVADENLHPVYAAPRMDEKHLHGKENLRGCPRIFSTPMDFAHLGMMLANGGEFHGKRIMSGQTIDLMRPNQLSEQQLEDFDGRVTMGYGYGYGVRTLMDKAKAGSNGSIGEFGWEGGSGPYFLVDPEKKFSLTVMYQRGGADLSEIHLKLRNTAYGCL